MLGDLVPACYLSGSPLLPLVTTKAVTAMLQTGICGEGAYITTLHGQFPLVLLHSRRLQEATLRSFVAASVRDLVSSVLAEEPRLVTFLVFSLLVGVAVSGAAVLVLPARHAVHHGVEPDLGRPGLWHGRSVARRAPQRVRTILFLEFALDPLLPIPIAQLLISDRGLLPPLDLLSLRCDF